MEYIVLGLLLLGEMTIYQLNSAFKQGLSLIYSASYGNLQHAVKKLLRDNYITFTETVENGRKKKIYRVNEAGTEYFFKWMHSEIPMNKLETGMLSRIYFLGLVENKENRLKILRSALSLVEKAATDLTAMNEEFSEIDIPAEYREIGHFQLKTLDYGIMSHEAGRHWLIQLIRDSEQ